MEDGSLKLCRLPASFDPRQWPRAVVNQKEVTEVASAPTILVEGAYSASPPLRDLIDLAVLVDVQNKRRYLGTGARGDDTEFLAKWHAIWDPVEMHYFQHVCPPESFDCLIRNDDNIEPSS